MVECGWSKMSRPSLSLNICRQCSLLVNICILFYHTLRDDVADAQRPSAERLEPRRWSPLTLFPSRCSGHYTE